MALIKEQLLIDLENATTSEEVSIISQKLQSLLSVERSEADNTNNKMSLTRNYADILRQLSGRDELSEEIKTKVLKMAEADLPSVVTPQAFIYLHVNVTDGDGKEPIGVKNDGVNYLSVEATFRVSSDPGSTVIATITEQEWRVTVRDANDAIYDVVNVKFVSGICTFQYVTTNSPTFCSIIESDFDLVEMAGVTYKILLVDEVIFKVYRDFK